MSSARTVQRVVLPPGLDPDVLALYVEEGEGRTATIPMVTSSTTSSSPPVRGATSPPSVGTAGQQHPDNVLDRHRLRVPAGTRISFATYFNAFPASYWQRWTRLKEVELRVRLSGPGSVSVYRSSSAGASERVRTGTNSGEGQAELVFELPLTKFVDGGWYWFDVQAGPEAAIVEGAEWRTTDVLEGAEPSGSITLGITTFNRPTFLIDLLRQLGSAPDVLDVVDEVLVVDQGTQKVRDQEAYEEVVAALQGKVRVIEQPNLGGSGGFARSMSETLQAGRSRYVLLIDDDVVAEPESILRGLAFADLCRHRTIVGGHMLNLYAPSHLHSLGEIVRPWRFSWGPHPQVEEDHDLRVQGLRATPWMHRRIDVDFNAWWMCLIPVEVLKTIGLSMPFFIKWDDAEFGLRAKKAGFPTVSLPGMAVWHMPWSEKDDVLDWQAYFHQRNRLVTALLHSRYHRGGRVVRDSLYQQIRHLLAMQYSTAELRLRALQDVLDGPEGLHAQLAVKLPEVRALRAQFPDSSPTSDHEAFPPVSEGTLRKDRQPQPPTTRPRTWLTAALAAVQQVRPVDPEATKRPQATVAALDAHWWRLAQLDSAVVSALDGTSMSWYRRDRDKYLQLLSRSVQLHKRLLEEWPALSAGYKDAADDLVSPQSWARTFERRQP